MKYQNNYVCIQQILYTGSSQPDNWRQSTKIEWIFFRLLLYKMRCILFASFIYVPGLFQNKYPVISECLSTPFCIKEVCIVKTHWNEMKGFQGKTRHTIVKEISHCWSLTFLTLDVIKLDKYSFGIYMENDVWLNIFQWVSSKALIKAALT